MAQPRPPVYPGGVASHGTARADVGAEVEIDYVRSVPNAATVIARLYQGEKTLVFCDSRRQAEELTVALRALGAPAHISHSSLSADERRHAEVALAAPGDGIFVATSAMELGLDIADLARVIQVGAATTVRSFTARLGRAGRRGDSRRGTLVLATTERTLWLAAAVASLWERGHLDGVNPPALPHHIVAQQLLGTVLQQGQVVRAEVSRWLDPAPAATPDASTVLAHLLARGFLIDAAGLLSLGPRAEKDFGRRHFLDLTSSFADDPSILILWGGQSLGHLPPAALTATPADGRARSVLLGGRAWTVDQVDWRRRRAWVRPSDGAGWSTWSGEARPMSAALAGAHHDVLAGTSPGVRLSRRAAAGLGELRAAHPFIGGAAGSDIGRSTYLHRDTSGRLTWWTFAGLAANQTLAAGLGDLIDSPGSVGDLRFRLHPHVGVAELRRAIFERREELIVARPRLADDAVESLAFWTAVPRPLLEETLMARLSDPVSVHAVLAARMEYVTPKT